MNLVIANRQRTKPVNARQLKIIVAALFDELRIKDGDLGINLVGEREMTLVNETFLQHEGSTDVITFDHHEAAQAEVPVLHGELFVCVDEAILQARRFRTEWQPEVVRYIVHGLLHLRGYDDHGSVPRRKMKREENRLVRLLAKKFSLAQIAGGSKMIA
jgi:probable rRNA maturation factor